MTDIPPYLVAIPVARGDSFLLSLLFQGRIFDGIVNKIGRGGTSERRRFPAIYVFDVAGANGSFSDITSQGDHQMAIKISERRFVSISRC